MPSIMQSFKDLGSKLRDSSLTGLILGDLGFDPSDHGPVIDWIERNDYQGIPFPDNAVRRGPFNFKATFTDNGAIPNASSLVSTIIDVGLLRGNSSGSDAVSDQIVMVEGFRILFGHYSSEVPDSTPDELTDVFASSGLYFKTGSNASPGFEEFHGVGDAFGTVLQTAAVEDTNAATVHRVGLRGHDVPWKMLERPVPLYIRNDTVQLVFGKQINTAANLDVLVQVRGIAFNWRIADRRPGLKCPPDSGLFHLRRLLKRQGRVPISVSQKDGSKSILELI